MSKFTIGIAVIVLATALSAASYAAPPEKAAPQRAAVRNTRLHRGPLRNARPRLGQLHSGSCATCSSARALSSGPHRRGRLRV